MKCSRWPRNGKTGHFTSSKGPEWLWNAQKWKLHVQWFLLLSSSCWLKGALTYFLGCVAKEYVCGITWKFFATHRSFYNTALVINIEIEQWRHPATPMITWPETKISIILEVCHFDDRFSVDLVCLYKFTLNYAEILFDCFNANFKTQV